MEQTITASGKDVARALQLFLRAVRARQTHGARNSAAARALAEAHQALRAVVEPLGVLSVGVDEDRLLFEEETVLSEPSSPEALSSVLYHDGVRRLDFSRGLEPAELEILISATADSDKRTRIGDDVGTLLWGEDLPHIRCRIDDPTDPDLERDLDLLLGSLCGEAGEDAARSIARRLSSIDAGAAGPHPAQSLQPAAASAPRLAVEALEEDPRRSLLRAIAAARDALSIALADTEIDGVLNALLRMFDSAIEAGDLETAAAIVSETRAASLPEARILGWLEEVCSEARGREMTARYADAQTEETAAPLFGLLRAIGHSAAPIALGALSSVVDAESRRRFSDLALELGIEGIEPLRGLLSNDLLSVMQEGMYLLSQIGTPEAIGMLERIAADPRAETRAALAEVADQLHERIALDVATRFLGDPYLKARIAGARALSKIPSKHAARIIEEAVLGPTFEDATFEVKVAFLESYAILNQLRSLLLLSKHMKRAEGILVRREIEDLGIASTLAMQFVPTKKSVEFLKQACVVRNKRLRETAREVLLRMKEGVK